MSREERRNYERMMRNMERGPSLPPAAKARAERNARRRSARSTTTPTYAFTPRFLVVTTLVALAIGFLAFSVQWPNMPFALYVGGAVAVVAFIVQLALRYARRRASAG